MTRKQEQHPCHKLREWLWNNEVSYQEFGLMVGVSAVAVWKWIWIGFKPRPKTLERVILVTEGEITEADWS